MNCPNGCKTEPEIQSIQKLFLKDGKPIIIQNLQVKVCPECGQEMIPLATMRVIEKVLNGEIAASGKVEADVFQPV